MDVMLKAVTNVRQAGMRIRPGAVFKPRDAAEAEALIASGAAVAHAEVLTDEGRKAADEAASKAAGDEAAAKKAAGEKPAAAKTAKGH